MDELVQFLLVEWVCIGIVFSNGALPSVRAAGCGQLPLTAAYCVGNNLGCFGISVGIMTVETRSHLHATQFMQWKLHVVTRDVQLRRCTAIICDVIYIAFIYVTMKLLGICILSLKWHDFSSFFSLCYLPYLPLFSTTNVVLCSGLHTQTSIISIPSGPLLYINHCISTNCNLDPTALRANNNHI